MMINIKWEVRAINQHKVKLPNYSFFLFLLVLSLYFGRFNLYLGFSLKPFMIVTGMIPVFFIYRFKISKLFTFEILMIVFVLFHSLTALKFNYPSSSIRFIILYLIIMFYYFVTRWLITNISIEKLEAIIYKTGIIGVICSLIYYLMGLLASGFNYRGNNISYYGLLIDRSIPRLTGVASTDPNIFVFYITLFLFYTLSNLERKRNKIGCFLSLIAIILSFSRGAYISVVIGVIFWFFISKNKMMKIKFLLGILICTFVLFCFSDVLPFNPFSFIINRFVSFGKDGGSGRFTIWMNALNAFKSNPITGIGINSILKYNLANYSRAVYVHNSLLEVLVETGIVGFIIYFVFWISLFIYSIRVKLIDQRATYIFTTLIAMFIQMNALSILYNEAFYFTVVILYRYSRERLNSNIKYQRG